MFYLWTARRCGTKKPAASCQVWSEQKVTGQVQPVSVHMLVCVCVCGQVNFKNASIGNVLELRIQKNLSVQQTSVWSRGPWMNAERRQRTRQRWRWRDAAGFLVRLRTRAVTIIKMKKPNEIPGVSGAATDQTHASAAPATAAPSLWVSLVKITPAKFLWEETDFSAWHVMRKLIKTLTLLKPRATAACFY